MAKKDIDETEKRSLTTGSTLANRWRPKTWDDVCGHVTQVNYLKGRLEECNIPNAILLSGPSGVGKTTLARVFARYINCENGTSCGECAACKMMDSGESFDYREVDGGSNGGINDIRAIINEAQMMPVNGALRIIVLDECQAVTGAAQTALLKTLEEPPAHTLFILCTMQLEKISPAILGRCVHLQLKRVLPEYVADHLRHIAKQERMKLPKSVFEDIANATGGQLRNALQMLDMVWSVVVGNGDSDDIEDVINTALSEVTSMGDDNLAVQALSDIYAKKGESQKTLKSLIRTAGDVQSAISFSNALLWQNEYLISTTADPKTERVYHTPINIKAKEAVGKVQLYTLLSVHKHLVALRQELVQVSGQDTALLYKRLSDAWFEVFDSEDSED